VEVTQARLDSYTEDNIQNSPEIDRVTYGSGGPELVEGDPLEPVNGPIIGSSGGTQNIEFFTEASGRSSDGPQKDDTVAFTLEFDGSDTRQYSITL
jgi:hypothetical protein